MILKWFVFLYLKCKLAFLFGNFPTKGLNFELVNILVEPEFFILL